MLNRWENCKKVRHILRKTVNLAESRHFLVASQLRNRQIDCVVVTTDDDVTIFRRL